MKKYILGLFVTASVAYAATNTTINTTNLVIKEASPGLNKITIVPPTFSTNYTLTLPTTAGSSSQVLSTNGSGVLSWVTAASASSNMVGPGASVDSEVALFSGTAGTTLQRASGTGFAKLTSGVLSASSTVDAATELSGLVPMVNGGTNANITASHGGVAYSTASALALSSVGTADKLLKAQGAAAPVWTSETGIVSLNSGILSTASTVSMSAGGTNSSLTALNGGVAYSTASAISLSAAGTSGQPLVSGGAGMPTWASGTGFAKLTSGVLSTTTSLDATSALTGAVNVPNGGTGLTTLTANNVLLGNGTSAVQFVAPGTSGNVLTSNGTTWTSTSVAGTGDVVGPASSVDNEVTLFNGTTGKAIKRASSTGVMSMTAGVLSTATTVSLAAGGTNAAITASNGAVAFSTASAISLSPVGTAGQVLISNGAATPTFGVMAGHKNRLINGDMRIDQRNLAASQTITAGAALAYTVDRWYANAVGGSPAGRRVAGAGATKYVYQVTGAASTTAVNFCQRIEAQNVTDLAGGTAVVSVELSNSLLSSVTWALSRATTTDDTFGTIASPTVTAIASGTFTVTSSPVVYSTGAISIPSAATTGLQLCFGVGAQTSGTWKISNAQLEAGSVATGFEQRPIGLEMMLAQRYLPAYTSLSGSGNETMPGTANGLNTSSIFIIPYPVVARAVPTGVILSGVGHFSFSNSNGNAACSDLTYATGSKYAVQLTCTMSTVGGTIVPGYIFMNNASANMYFTGAEL